MNIKAEQVVGEVLPMEIQVWRKKHTDWISNHFYMGELTYSARAVERGMDNTPSPEAEAALKNLVKKLLEPLRVYTRDAIVVSSGYRSEELNRLVGGVRDSQHLKGEAVDIYTFGSVRLLEDLLNSGLNFDQAILYRARRFIHLSLKNKGVNRRQVLIR